MSDDSSRTHTANTHPLYAADGGRTRRGLAIVAVCVLFWVAVVSLWLYS